MMELRDRKCAEHYGEDVWARADAKTKACFNFLCGNHTRNLPNVRFNKVHYHPQHNSPPFHQSESIISLPQLYDKWLQTELGEEMRVAKAACGKLGK